MNHRTSILVWDAPVRVFHWLLVLCFAGAWLTAESERWQLAHVTLGYTAVGLIAFRLIWGGIGTRHARFASFVRGPAAAGRYLAGLVRGRPDHHVGHNPAGALAIVALLLGVLAIGVTGWATDSGLGADWLEGLHEGLATATLAVVAVHVAGVVVGSRLHRENLVAAMVTGRKHGSPDEAIGHAWRSVAGLMVVAVAAFWTLQWQAAPAAGLAAAEPSAQAAARSPLVSHRHGHGQPRRERRDDDDDD